MEKLASLKNPLKYYAWGSENAIPELLGFPVIEGKPVAEMWIGAHHLGSSEILQEDGQVSLQDLITKNPDQYLGHRIYSRFGPELPFLMKVLAASQPLSLQAHPDRIQAISGFQMENSRRIALDDPRRNYKDRNAKPECVCALTPFTAMCGFRPAEAVLGNFWPFSDLLDGELRNLKNAVDEAAGLRVFFRNVLELDPERKSAILIALRQQGAMQSLDHAASNWIEKLLIAFPTDIGCLAPLFMNVIQLEPGEALFLPPNTLHAYLGGLAIEIMGNSDNVLRAGLTAKHIDIEELIGIVNFNPAPAKPVHALPLNACESIYPTPAAEFRLSRIDLSGTGTYDIQNSAGIELYLCTQGSVAVRTGSAADSNQFIGIERGMSFLVMPSCSSVSLSGSGSLFRAIVP